MDQTDWMLEAAAEETDDIIADLLQSPSSDEERDLRRGGSRPGRASNVSRDHSAGAVRLYNDYFSPSPVYGKKFFRRRYRLSKRTFLRVFSVVQSHDNYFKQRKDATGKLGLSGLQKVTAAMRQLAYGYAADAIDEYLRIGASTADRSLHCFCNSVTECFEEVYLRAPTETDIRRILTRAEKRGFPGMLGSIDCYKWVWKNCPVAWHGQYEGKEGDPTVTFEAIADDTLWIWHAFFGMPGSGNDLNVLGASPLLNNIANGTYPPSLSYKIAGVIRSIPHWLANGIYPEWPVFVQKLVEPVTREEKHMAAMRAAASKDVKRAFGVLQSKWHIVA